MTAAELTHRVREHLDVTQRELGLLLGADPVTVTRWESGLYTPNPYREGMLQTFLKKPKPKKGQIKHLLAEDGVIVALARIISL